MKTLLLVGRASHFWVVCDTSGPGPLTTIGKLLIKGCFIVQWPSVKQWLEWSNQSPDLNSRDFMYFKLKDLKRCAHQTPYYGFVLRSWQICAMLGLGAFLIKTQSHFRQIKQSSMDLEVLPLWITSGPYISRERCTLAIIFRGFEKAIFNHSLILTRVQCLSATCHISFPHV